MENKNKKARVIAFYLPQFHPIPENDEWWGKGFTEWTNVRKAKPLFKGHYQPRVPADLGYYDLRVSETRIAQAELAREAGIEGFCYWHYWFGNGKRLLERPFNEVLTSGKPDFPFCLAWANETWKGFPHGLMNRNVLIEQSYPGIYDYINHFNFILNAFKDKRYITIDNKPVFIIYKPLDHPDIKIIVELWQRLARENNLKGIYFIGQTNVEERQLALDIGMDAVNNNRMMDYIRVGRPFTEKIIDRILKPIFHCPRVYNYSKVMKWFVGLEDKELTSIPSIFSGWDHTPRSGYDGLVFNNYNPRNFGKHVDEVLESIDAKPAKNKFVMLKSWNEWAEGNYVEPDLKYGKQFLEVLKSKLFIKH